MRPVGLTAVLLLSACQPQARRLLVLDLALSEPALLNGTVQPWRDEGYNVEYRRFSLATVRNENQYRFSFTLANIGSFGNLRRSERMF